MSKKIQKFGKKAPVVCQCGTCYTNFTSRYALKHHNSTVDCQPQFFARGVEIKKAA